MRVLRICDRNVSTNNFIINETVISRLFNENQQMIVKVKSDIEDDIKSFDNEFSTEFLSSLSINCFPYGMFFIFNLFY